MAKDVVSGRQAEPDMAKAAGIILVVFGHVLRGLFSAGIVEEEGILAAIDRMIYLFHMPLFFYLSGLFAEKSVMRDGSAAFTRKMAETLLLPLIVWSYIQFTIQFAAGGAVNNPVSLIGVLTAPFPPRQQFWFLGSLFLISAVMACVLRQKNSHAFLKGLMVLLFAGQAIFWGGIQSLMVQNLGTFLFAQTLVHMPFFILGTLYGTGRIRQVRVPEIICVTVFVASLYAYEALSFADGWVRMVASVLCVLSLYKIIIHLCDRASAYGSFLRWGVFIGMNSMIIYLAHVIAAAGFRIILQKLGIEQASLHIAGGFLSGLIGPLLLVPVGLKLAKHYPRLARAIFPVRYERKAHLA